ncbi:Phosphatidylinositol 4,5-bisphosphate 3-kinase catalytic subunit gamma isoform [Aphanomyces cochlioides]|nr:Phosphatidylinositol 4,5-bisphosphate 3-kinase catalytic subunit gamma isoform [Aphanomyces cochlioides]
MRSLAGYSVATYILGLGNRQYDNIMMTHEGRVFLIDLSHFLGVYKYVPLLNMTLKRDRTPFVLTPQMSFVFGGETSPGFLKFIKLCGDAFNVVRQHLHLVVTLLVLMLPAELPELVDREAIQYIVETVCPELDKTEAFLHFETLVRQIHSFKWNTASY